MRNYDRISAGSHQNAALNAANVIPSPLSTKKKKRKKNEKLGIIRALKSISAAQTTKVQLIFF